MVRRVRCQKWGEVLSDGSIKPKGFSIHLTDEDRREYKLSISYFVNSPPIGAAQPMDEPYWTEVDEEIYKLLQNTKKQVWKNELPISCLRFIDGINPKEIG